MGDGVKAESSESGNGSRLGSSSCSAGDLEPDVGSEVEGGEGEDHSEHGTDKVRDIEPGER